MLIEYLIAFGGVGLFALVGFLYVWFTTSPASKTKRTGSHAGDDQSHG